MERMDVINITGVDVLNAQRSIKYGAEIKKCARVGNNKFRVVYHGRKTLGTCACPGEVGTMPPTPEAKLLDPKLMWMSGGLIIRRH